MMALKNAYAEIIFNITKEAAARVMLSEQKALEFQKDLEFTKQEALRMFLRLKQMSDATVILFFRFFLWWFFPFVNFDNGV